MGRTAKLNEAEKSTIIKETAKGTSLHDVSRIWGQRVDTFNIHVKDSSPRKSRSDRCVLKVTTQCNLQKIIGKLCGKPGHFLTVSKLLETNYWRQWPSTEVFDKDLFWSPDAKNAGRIGYKIHEDKHEASYFQSPERHLTCLTDGRRSRSTKGTNATNDPYGNRQESGEMIIW